MADNPRQMVMDAAEKAQSVRPENGLWRRGAEYLTVTDAANGLWTGAGGDEHQSTPKEFRQRLAEKLSLPKEGVGTFLDHAWVIASARGAQPVARIITLVATNRRAPSLEDRAQVTRWLGQLQQGQEPTRNA